MKLIIFLPKTILNKIDVVQNSLSRGIIGSACLQTYRTSVITIPATTATATTATATTATTILPTSN